MAYYARHEPSSPIPLFIERCKRLVTMGFKDIVKELVPDAVRQVEVLTGPSKSDFKRQRGRVFSFRRQAVT